MIVVDSNLVIHALLGADARQQVRALTTLIDPLTACVAPDIIVGEVIGRIAYEQRTGTLSADGAHAAMQDFTGLDIDLYPIESGDAPRLLELGANMGAMDACFTVLGERLAADVVTYDDKMIDAAAKAGARCRVRRP